MQIILFIGKDPWDWYVRYLWVECLVNVLLSILVLYPISNLADNVTTVQCPNVIVLVLLMWISNQTFMLIWPERFLWISGIPISSGGVHSVFCTIWPSFLAFDLANQKVTRQTDPDSQLDGPGPLGRKIPNLYATLKCSDSGLTTTSLPWLIEPGSFVPPGQLKWMAC